MIEISNLGGRLDIALSNYEWGVNKTSYCVEIYLEQSFVGLFNLLKVTIIFSDVHKLVPVFWVLKQWSPNFSCSKCHSEDGPFDISWENPSCIRDALWPFRVTSRMALRSSALGAFKISLAGKVQQQDGSEIKARRLEHQFKCVMIYKMINIKPLVNIQGIVQIDLQWHTLLAKYQD